jgi:hypothetical protein
MINPSFRSRSARGDGKKLQLVWKWHAYYFDSLTDVIAIVLRSSAPSSNRKRLRFPRSREPIFVRALDQRTDLPTSAKFQERVDKSKPLKKLSPSNLPTFPTFLLQIDLWEKICARVLSQQGSKGRGAASFMIAVQFLR